VDALEPRTLFTAPTLAALPSSVTLYSGTSLQIPLDGFDADGDALTFSRTLSSQNITATFTPSANRSLKITVNHTSSGAGDVAITNESMVLKLFEDKAPNTTARIIQLAQQGFYNNLTFHRVINNFMIQGGDPMGNGAGGSGTSFDDEFTSNFQFTGSGLLAMAKSYDDTNDSQFFITEVPTRSLDFNHTIFGQLVEGESTRDKISNVLTGANDKPINPVTMTVGVIPDNQNGVLTLTAPNSLTSGTITVSVVARDPGGAASAPRTITVNVAPDPSNENPYLVNPPSQLSTTMNAPVNFQLNAFDNEGDPFVYLDYYSIWYNFVYNPYAGQHEAARTLAPDPNQFIQVALDGNTGAGTVTPTNNLVGVFPLYFGVARDKLALDTQIIPLFVAPAAPTSVSLVASSDTGTSNSDRLTRLNNANAASKLQFQVDGVLAGARVDLYDGNTLIGQATVSAGATSVVVPTSGTAVLGNGGHSITAKQVLANYAWAVGNQSGTTDLAGPASAGLGITVDAVAPTIVGLPTFAFGGANQPLTYNFSEDVSGSLVVGDLAVKVLPNGPTILPGSIQLAWDAANKRATFTFPAAGTLADGDYEAKILAGNVTDAAGNPLPADSVFTFYVLAGDLNRDRKVDFNDLVALAQNYNTSGKTYVDGDFTLDGKVDFNDLVVLAQRYNTALGGAPVQGASATLSFSDAWAAALAAPAQTASPTDKRVFSTVSVVKPLPRRPIPAKPPRR
jgi:cyclophilin family peptidyl-prolyl cis-trans isomerase